MSRKIVGVNVHKEGVGEGSGSGIRTFSSVREQSGKHARLLAKGFCGLAGQLCKLESKQVRCVRL
jgi:hypothetical protein